MLEAAHEGLDVEHVAQQPVGDGPPDGPEVLVPPPALVDGEDQAAGAGLGQEGIGVGDGEAQRLLQGDVLAGPQQLHGDGGVGDRRQGDDGHVHFVVVGQLGDGGVGPDAGEVLLRRLAPVGVEVAGGHQLQTGSRRRRGAVDETHAAVGPVADDAQAQRGSGLGQVRPQGAAKHGAQGRSGQGGVGLAEARDHHPPAGHHHGPVLEAVAHGQHRAEPVAGGLQWREGVDDRELGVDALGQWILGRGDPGEDLAGVARPAGPGRRRRRSRWPPRGGRAAPTTRRRRRRRRRPAPRSRRRQPAGRRRRPARRTRGLPRSPPGGATPPAGRR